MFGLENERLFLPFLTIALAGMSILDSCSQSVQYVGMGGLNICLQNVICIYLLLTFGW
jgi:hypothetical protein